MPRSLAAAEQTPRTLAAPRKSTRGRLLYALRQLGQLEVHGRARVQAAQPGGELADTLASRESEPLDPLPEFAFEQDADDAQPRAGREIAAAQSGAASLSMGFRPHERRSHPRRDSDCTVTIGLRPNEQEVPAARLEWLLHSSQSRGRLVDVSMNGMAFRMAWPLETEVRLILQVSNRRFDQKVITLGTVLRCTKTGEQEWTVVCRLEKSLTFEQVHQIGKHLFSSTIV